MYPNEDIFLFYFFVNINLVNAYCVVSFIGISVSVIACIKIALNKNLIFVHCLIKVIDTNARLIWSRDIYLWRYMVG